MLILLTCKSPEENRSRGVKIRIWERDPKSSRFILSSPTETLTRPGVPMHVVPLLATVSIFASSIVSLVFRAPAGSVAF